MIQTAEVSITYKGDGVQTSFPYPYPYRNSADIIGYIINDIGYETRITTNFKYDEVSNTYQYPLSGEPLSSSYSIKLIRETPQQQNAALPSKLPFSLIEKSLDWIIMILQEIGSRSNNLWNTRNDCKLSETNARNSASAAANSEDKARLSENNAKSSANAAANSENMAKKWAIDTTSPDGATDNDSYTGKTQSSRIWALYSKEQAQAAKVSETNSKLSETNAKSSETKAAVSATNAKTSETNAKTSERTASDSASASASSASASTMSATNAKTSETKALASENNAKTSETKALASEQNAKDSETNASASAEAASSSETNALASEVHARTYATNAANSAKQAAESAGVFQDFTGATATTDGTGGKVPKPLAGQQNKVLKADGTWGDGVTPKTLWDGMHSYPVNYVPADLSNVGWNQLGFCSIYYTQNKINNQPTQYGQLINIPADANNESTQLWIEQNGGTIFSRGGNGNIRVNDTSFKRFATLDDVNSAEKVDSQGNNWIRYKSGLQMCWNNKLKATITWTFPVPFSSSPAAVSTSHPDSEYGISGFSQLSNTSCKVVEEGDGVYVCAIVIGRWK
nr:MAG TPA: L SHAPED TAIL FIBER PROTEIN [Caudoviricetes sp.]